MPRLINVGDSTGDHQSSLKAQRKNLKYVSGWRIEAIIQGDHK